MFQLCHQLGCSMVDLLQDSVRATLHKQSESQPQALNKGPVKVAVSSSTITLLPLQHISDGPDAGSSFRPSRLPHLRPVRRKGKGPRPVLAPNIMQSSC
jgi:hypothetical protein